jgi:hypothetical protein
LLVNKTNGGVFGIAKVLKTKESATKKGGELSTLFIRDTPNKGKKNNTSFQHLV